MKTSKTSNHQGQQGFTLIELSIVLVIIGLIVGGVLVGQDLIKAAQLRAALNQIQTYDTAVNAFQAKYNAIPGDITAPGNFGLDGPNGNGNGVVDNSDSTHPTYFDLEPAVFFRQLYQANLVSDNIAGVASYAAAAAALTGVTKVTPPSKLGKGTQVMPVSTGGVNYYLLDNMTLTSGVYALVRTAVSPLDAYSIDSKMDDGVPSTGGVVAVATDHANIDAGHAAGSGYCVDSGPAPTIYNTTIVADSTVGSCALRIRASW